MSVVDLSHYNIPHISEKDSKAWIEFGLDNLYPQYLIELFTGSGINSAIIKGVAAMIAGDQQGTYQGLDVVDKDILEGEAKEQYLVFAKLLNRGDRNTVKNLAFDLKLFGSCYVNVIWNKTRTAVHEIKHVPAQYIRSGKVDSYGNVNEFWYCYDWSNERKYKPHVIKAFDPENRTHTSQLLQIKEYNPQSFYYGICDYVGGTDYIKLDMSIAELHLANIENNFMPSCMVNFSNGIPTDEERMEVERKLNAKFSGSGNSGKLILTFNEGKDTAPEVIPLNTGDNDDKYQFLSSEVSRKVLTAHRIVSPLLFGVKGDGSGFGNNAEEIKDSFELLLSSVIKPFQSTLLEGLEKIFRVNGIDSLDIYFKTVKPAEFIDAEKVIEEEKEGIDIEDVTIEKMEELIAKHKKKKFNKEIDTKPTKGMVEEAKKGLEWRKEYGRGGTEVGVARARDISNGKNLSIETIKRMNSFFARHEKSSKGGEGFEPGQDGFPSAGRIAWALWGGDAGQSWAAKKVKQIENKENDLSDEEMLEIQNNLEGEQIDEDVWVEVDQKRDDDDEGIDLWVNRKIRKRIDFANEIPSNDLDGDGTKTSYLDKSYYKIRFRYVRKDMSRNKSGSGSREFCRNMMALQRQGFVYRIEDIDKAERDGVNSKFGHGKGGSPYNLFMWKGGPFCKHAWEMVLYRLKAETIVVDGDDVGEDVYEGDYEEVKTIPKSYIPSPWGWKIAQQANNKMKPNRGRYPGWEQRKDKI